jgi:hypothetical protein
MFGLLKFLFVSAITLVFLIPAALVLAVVGLPIAAVLGVLALPVLIVLFIVGLPIFLVLLVVFVVCSVLFGVLGAFVGLTVGAIKLVLLVVSADRVRGVAAHAARRRAAAERGVRVRPWAQAAQRVVAGVRRVRFCVPFRVSSGAGR